MNKFDAYGDPSGQFSVNGWKDPSVPTPLPFSIKQHEPYSIPENKTCKFMYQEHPKCIPTHTSYRPDITKASWAWFKPRAAGGLPKEKVQHRTNGALGQLLGSSSTEMLWATDAMRNKLMGVWTGTHRNSAASETTPARSVDATPRVLAIEQSIQCAAKARSSAPHLSEKSVTPGFWLLLCCRTLFCTSKFQLYAKCWEEELGMDAGNKLSSSPVWQEYLSTKRGLKNTLYKPRATVF